MIRFIKSSLLFLSIPSLFAQSAWLRSEGETYLQFSSTGIFNYDSQFFDGTEEYKLHTSGSDLTLNLYAEYGLSDNTTLVASLPYKFLHFEETNNIDPIFDDANNQFVQYAKGGSLNGLSNMEIGIRQMISEKKINIAGQLVVMANSIKVDSDKGLRTGYDAMIVKPSIAIGYGKSAYFSQAHLEYEYFNNSYSDRLNGYIESGIKFKDQLWVIGYIDAVISLKNGELSEIPEVWAGLFLNNQEYIGIGLKLIYELKEDIGITFNPGTAISANHLPKAPALTIGAFAKF